MPGRPRCEEIKARKVKKTTRPLLKIGSRYPTRILVAEAVGEQGSLTAIAAIGLCDVGLVMTLPWSEHTLASRREHRPY
jgi:hypothetical protein